MKNENLKRTMRQKEVVDGSSPIQPFPLQDFEVI